MSVLYFVLRDDGRLFELATSSMCNFEGRTESVGPVGTMFAITLVIMIAKPIKTTLFVHQLESSERKRFRSVGGHGGRVDCSV